MSTRIGRFFGPNFRAEIVAVAIVAAAVVVFSIGCDSTPPSTDLGTLKVVATTGYVYDVVSRVAGERGHVALLMGPGVDPHLFKPTARDVATLRGARIIFYNGLHLEGKLQEVLHQMETNGATVVPISRSMPKEELLAPPQFEGHYDPHVWNAPELWALTPNVVAEALAEADPEGATYYQANADNLTASYEAVLAEALAMVSAIPKERRVLVTSHDAFNYLGRAFGFEVVAPQGISTLSEAGMADIVETASFIRERGVSAIFVESSVPHAVIERIAQESGARIGGELFSDAMGTPGDVREVLGIKCETWTYEGLMRYNIGTIVEALTPAPAMAASDEEAGS